MLFVRASGPPATQREVNGSPSTVLFSRSITRRVVHGHSNTPDHPEPAPGSSDVDERGCGAAAGSRLWPAGLRVLMLMWTKSAVAGESMSCA